MPHLLLVLLITAISLMSQTIEDRDLVIRDIQASTAPGKILYAKEDRAVLLYLSESAINEVGMAEKIGDGESTVRDLIRESRIVVLESLTPVRLLGPFTSRSCALVNSLPGLSLGKSCELPNVRALYRDLMEEIKYAGKAPTIQDGRATGAFAERAQRFLDHKADWFIEDFYFQVRILLGKHRDLKAFVKWSDLTPIKSERQIL